MTISESAEEHGTPSAPEGPAGAAGAGRETPESPGDAAGRSRDPGDSGNAPVDKKRIALLNGACGRSHWVLVSGQVVDIPVTSTQKAEKWDPLLALPFSQKKKIRPIQDFGMAGVRRARLRLEILATPLGTGNIDEEPAIFSSEPFTTGDNSFFQVTLDTSLQPGAYIVRVVLLGIDSLRQSISDLAYIGDSNSLILKKDVIIGHGRLSILPDDYTGYVITSDIDQTFLNTKIDSNRGLVGTMFEEPNDKEPLPGMPELFREFQRGPRGPMPLYFISASPHFFRRSLSSLFDQLDVSYTGLNLKYLMNTFDSVVRKTFQAVMNLDDIFSQGLQGAVERSLKFLGSSLDSLFDHISYKLSTLLENRLMQPTGARELLIGDNTESDYFIFSLYQYLIAGAIPEKGLEEYLYHLRFLDREALTRDTAKVICRLVQRNLDRHGGVNSVEEVWINQARSEPSEEAMRSLVKEALPAVVNEEAAARVVPVRACYGAPGFALAAVDSGFLAREALPGVWAVLRGKEIRDERLSDERLRTIVKEFEFRNAARSDIESALGLSGG